MQSFDIRQKQAQIFAGAGKIPADLVIKNVSYLNVFTESFERADVAIHEGVFAGITAPGGYSGKEEIDGSELFMVPGFMDGHIHLESTTVQPAEFAKAVIPHGTTAVIADPHEITNVCGRAGLDYILESTKDLDLDVYVMLPSCVPASPFDETGCVFTAEEMAPYMSDPRVLGLAEMMNYPGVLMGSEEVLEKLLLAEAHGKSVDGHAPGLGGMDLNGYNAAGIYTDHECTGMEEAMEKLRNGEWIMIREGTAGRNLEALMGMFEAPYYHHTMIATDDKHPGELIRKGHIDYIIREAIRNGAIPERAYMMASYHVAQCFGLKRRGAICPGYAADFVLLDDIKEAAVQAVYKCGKAVFQKGRIVEQTTIPAKGEVRDTVRIHELTEKDFQTKQETAKVIGLVKGEILTTDAGEASGVDPENDIIKLCVIERHHRTGHSGVAYLKGYGLKNGAVATTIAHDSHNLIIAGTNDSDMLLAAKHLEKIEGGMVVVSGGKVLGDLPCPIAGLMTALSAEEAQERMDELKEIARGLGVSDGIDPFMTLSFTSLPVIPKLKLTTQGVVDVEQFALIG
ncbi:MAG: adenine deaminase [Lachnospiraceae bacterium]